MNNKQRIEEGKELDDTYVNDYKDSHKNRDLTYKLSYTSYYFIDSLLTNYSIADIGIGTGGVFKSLKNVKKLIGVDASQKMLDSSDELLKDTSYEKVFLQGYYNEDFILPEKVDVIVLGVYGSYFPLSSEILEHTAKFLNKDGFLVVTLHTPDTLYKRIGVIIKMLMRKKPITQYEFIFEQYIPKNMEITVKIAKYPTTINNPEKGIIYFLKKLDD